MKIRRMCGIIQENKKGLYKKTDITTNMKLITDVHNHSSYSFDSETPLKEMLNEALNRGIAFYGAAEHFDIDVYVHKNDLTRTPHADVYFPEARHLREDYEGAINVLIGAEFAFSPDERVVAQYKEIAQTYQPDFIINSVHALYGEDYYDRHTYYEKGDLNGKLREKSEVYAEYLRYVRQSLDVPYPYDIVGHLGYAARYAPYADREMHHADHAALIDDILLTIIKKDKILEANGSSYGMQDPCVPSREILQRYYDLGGRKVSYGADAHTPQSLQRGREEIVKLLKEIGFTHFTVPCQGEHIKVEI